MSQTHTPKTKTSSRPEWLPCMTIICPDCGVLTVVAPGLKPFQHEYCCDACLQVREAGMRAMYPYW
jgi:acetone carboxylase gamma subunit